MKVTALRKMAAYTLICTDVSGKPVNLVLRVKEMLAPLHQTTRRRIPEHPNPVTQSQ
jgi:hypothetical protein